MPTYSYICNNCGCNFEIFANIKDYTQNAKCVGCDSINTSRRFIDDVLTQSSSVRKSDTELKTIGDLAKRNSEKLSEDEKIHLYQKHNAYKFEDSKKELPKGMNRVKKPQKIKWPGSKGKQKRKTNNGR